MSRDFYARLPRHTDFEEITEPERYAPVPEDWLVAVADVRGSTEAIAAGQYQGVNMIGAAVIIALLNLDRQQEWPFVFGGDGAAVLLPPDLAPAARQALRGTRRMAAREFGLDLRVGLMPVERLRAEGHALAVARFRLAPHYDQAMFSGSGLAHAEHLLRSDPAVALSAAEDAAADFSGLECRWQDVPSRYGETIALIVSASGDARRQGDTYREVLGAIRSVYGDDDRASPVVRATLRPAFTPRKLSGEARVRAPGGAARRWAYTARIGFQNVLLKLFVALKATTGSTYWPGYLDRLVTSTDFRKYDGTLRMVLSGTAEQRAELTRHLEAEREAGRLRYGLHASDRAHLTCVVFERMGRQVHFVDAADGGYAEAARALKRQLRA